MDAQVVSPASQLSSLIRLIAGYLVALDGEQVKRILQALIQVVDIFAPLVPGGTSFSALSEEQFSALADNPAAAEAKAAFEALGFKWTDAVRLAIAIIPLVQQVKGGDLSKIIDILNLIAEFVKNIPAS